MSTILLWCFSSDSSFFFSRLTSRCNVSTWAPSLVLASNSDRSKLFWTGKETQWWFFYEVKKDPSGYERITVWTRDLVMQSTWSVPSTLTWPQYCLWWRIHTDNNSTPREDKKKSKPNPNLGNNPNANSKVLIRYFTLRLQGTILAVYKNVTGYLISCNSGLTGVMLRASKP